MAIGIPGSRGLFGTLQHGLKHTDRYRIKTSKQMRDELADFECLSQELGRRPTKIAEIVPDHPVAVGSHDASGKGMGGIWLPATTNSNLVPTLWRSRFPDDIVNDLRLVPLLWFPSF